MPLPGREIHSREKKKTISYVANRDGYFKNHVILFNKQTRILANIGTLVMHKITFYCPVCTGRGRWKLELKKVETEP